MRNDEAWWLPDRRRKDDRYTIRTLLLTAVGCLCLSACAVGPDYHTPDVKLPDRFASAPSSDTDKKPVIDAAKWWHALGDKELDALIDRAVQNNPDLDIALNRMQEARAEETVVMGGALPEANASGGGGWGTGSDLSRGRADEPLVASDDTRGYKNVTQVVGFDAGWEIDLFGKYRREMEAAASNTQAAIAARNEVLISVIADVARAYVDMRGGQMQLAVLKKNIEVTENYLHLVQERYDRGITNELDVTLAQRQSATLQAQLMPLTSQIRASQYVIAVLLGKFPEDMAKELEKPETLPQLPEKIATGLPLDLLRRRPDIQEAERELASATARIGVATADLFPHLALTGGVGYQGQGISAAAASSQFIWSAGPSVSWALLDFGALDALVDVADLREKEFLANYKQTILGAVREVDTSISAYAGQQDRLRNLSKALTASQRAVSLATQRYDRGLTDSLNVVDAERQDYALENEYVLSQQAAAEQFIALYKALGGGWEQYQSFPPIRRPQPAILAAFTRLLKGEEK
ncbi:MAG: efflux transporter outer membrane subunit [Alphaproteobacteria bacterium]|nr:efflux transporter outer membrane subunit [Alphaproteobacteria bacterium]